MSHLSIEVLNGILHVINILLKVLQLILIPIELPLEIDLPLVQDPFHLVPRAF